MKTMKFLNRLSFWVIITSLNFIVFSGTYYTFINILKPNITYKLIIWMLCLIFTIFNQYNVTKAIDNWFELKYNNWLRKHISNKFDKLHYELREFLFNMNKI